MIANSNLKDKSYITTQIDPDIGQRIIKIAEKLSASETEIFMVKGSETNFSIEKDVINFASSSTEFGLGIRVIKDKRLGFGYCTTIKQAENAVKNAVSSTKLAKQLESKFVRECKFKNQPSIFDRSITDITVEDGLEYANQLINACKELDERVIVTGGGLGFGYGSVALITSTGAELEYNSTGIYAGVSTLLKDRSISTGFEYEHSRKNNLVPNEIGLRAGELAIKGQNPTAVEPGKYDIVLTPHAACELLEFTVIPGLYGEPANKGETVYSNKIGNQVMSANISAIDDGLMENGINTTPIDDEGTPTQKTVMVENGELKRYLYDRSSALEFDETSTGNALRSDGFGSSRSYKAIPKTKAMNFTLEGRTKTYDSIISELDNALEIHEILGAHTANPVSGDFSVNSPTLFKINSGEIVGAGKQVMIVGNMPELMKNIIALGNDFKDVTGGLTPIASRLPSIVIKNVNVI